MDEYRTAFEQLNIPQDVFDQIIADEGARGEICECLMLCLTSVPSLREVASALLQYIAASVAHGDGGPGSGNHGHAGVPGQVGGSAPSGITAVSDSCFPTDRYRIDPNQGWNAERSSYLSGKGFSDGAIKKLSDLTTAHIRGQEPEAEMKKFISENRDLVMAAASYETAAAQKRREYEIAEADKAIASAKEELEAVNRGEYDWMGPREYALQDAEDRLRSCESHRKKLDEPVKLYRKGGYEDTCLSFTTDHNGVVLNAGTDYETYLTPDHEATLQELESQGIFPIGGFGAYFNFYSGEGTEVTFVRVPAVNQDGGPGSGNHGHAGVPGQVGGSAPGNGSRAVVNGSDISRSYNGKPDIKSVMEAQGFTGLPKVVSKKEFDEAVKASSFIAQRTYSASSQEILDAYRNQLYNGEWYVECETGGAQYGQGMYCASDYNGELTDGIKSEMEYYQSAYRRLGEKRSEEEWLEAADKALSSKGIEDENARKWAEAYFERNHEKSAPLMAIISEEDRSKLNEILLDVPKTKEQPSFVETMTLDPSAKICTYNEIREKASDWAAECKRQYLEAHVGDLGISDQEAAFIVHRYGGADDESSTPFKGITREETVSWYRGLSKEEKDRVSKSEKVQAIVGKAREAEENFLRLDDGAKAAMKGYDAIKAENHGESGSYTVILNRTKTIFLDDNGHQDAKDDSVIFFQLGSDGVIYAIRAGKVIGWVSAGMSEDKNADSSEKPLDFKAQSATIKSKEDTAFDGAPKGNQNAAGPHKGGGGNGHKLSRAERTKLENRFVGKKSSKGTEVKKFSEHAFDRLGGRAISAGRFEKMLNSIDTKPDKNHPDRTLYDVPGSRMVLSDDGTVVSIMWRRQN